MAGFAGPAVGLCALAIGVGALAPAVAAAQDTRYVDPVFAEIETTRDVTYGVAVNNRGRVQSLELDLYQPVGDAAGARPVVVWTHGGAFRSGDKRDAGALARGFALRGYVAAAIEYRLRPPGTPGSMTSDQLLLASLAGEPDAIRDAQHDLQAAVRWLRAHAAGLRLDAGSIAVAGNSAGAITALEAAFNPEDPGMSGTPGVSSAVAAAVSVSGASDPRRIEPGAPPALMFHGTNDTTVPFALGAATCLATIGNGNVCEPVVWPGEGHGAAGEHSEEILATGSRFLCARIVAGCAAG